MENSRRKKAQVISGSFRREHKGIVINNKILTTKYMHILQKLNSSSQRKVYLAVK